MGSASLAAARPTARPSARTVTTISLQPGGLRGKNCCVAFVLINEYYFTLLCINILFQSHIFLCRFMDLRFVEIGAGHNWLRWSISRYPDGMSWCSSIACSMCSHGTCTLNWNMQSRNIGTYLRYIPIPIGTWMVPSPCWTRYRTVHVYHPGFIRPCVSSWIHSGCKQTYLEAPLWFRDNISFWEE